MGNPINAWTGGNRAGDAKRWFEVASSGDGLPDSAYRETDHDLKRFPGEASLISVTGEDSRQRRVSHASSPWLGVAGSWASLVAVSSRGSPFRGTRNIASLVAGRLESRRSQSAADAVQWL